MYTGGLYIKQCCGSGPIYNGSGSYLSLLLKLGEIFRTSYLISPSCDTQNQGSNENLSETVFYF